MGEQEPIKIVIPVEEDPPLKAEQQSTNATTAAAVFNIGLDEVTLNQRSFAKAVNFGLLYGMGAFRLSRDSDLTLAEAEQFIATYFERFPKVREYLDHTRDQAQTTGTVETLLGRRRKFTAFEEMDSSQQSQIRRRAAEREAVNMPIQGTAADILKLAMIQLHAALQERKLRGRMILQVHDELVLEVPEEEAEETAALVQEVMQNAYPLAVPLKVEAHIGQHWGELK